MKMTRSRLLVGLLQVLLVNAKEEGDLSALKTYPRNASHSRLLESDDHIESPSKLSTATNHTNVCLKKKFVSNTAAKNAL